ncbi:MAG: nucleotide exchange factor GrpE [Candidatus Woesearchaeota archaeon]|nr:MAG: nucleotide exchange factor GrpE [Candidatus Woesearchaeota archaeon]
MTTKKADEQKTKKPTSAEKAHDVAHERDELISQLQRLQAEFENYRKRTEGEKEVLMVYAKGDVIQKLLPLLDNFSLAFRTEQHGDEFVNGIKLIYSQLFDILENEGLQVIDATGQFDPTKHEALLTEKHEDKEHNLILEELQRGYTFKGRVLRNAKVKVNITR